MVTPSTPSTPSTHEVGRELAPVGWSGPPTVAPRPLVATTMPLILPIKQRRRRRLHLPHWQSRVPTWWTVAGPLLLALVVGFGSGYVPEKMLLLAVGAAALGGLLLRVEWAALAVVGTAVFEDYLVQVDPRVVKGLAVLLIGSWLLRRCAGRLHSRPRSAVLVAALVFVVVLLLSTAVHNNGTTGLAVLLRYAGFLGVLFVLTDVLRGILPPVRLARVYVAACALASLCGIVSYFLGEDRRVGGPIGDPNDFAFFLLPAIALAIGVRRSGKRRWPYDLAAAVIAFGVIGTLSRGALLGAAVMLLFGLLTRMVRVRAAVGLLVVLGTAVSFTAAAFPELVDVSLHQKSYVAGQNVSERLDLWKAAGQMTVENPVLGLGPGSFSLYHRDYMGSLPVDINHPLDVAHNTWLEASSELGFAGLLALVAIFLVAFAGAWSRWRRDHDPLAGAVCAAMLGTMTAASFVSEQYYLPLWLLSAFGAALAVHRSDPVEPTGATDPTRPTR